MDFFKSVFSKDPEPEAEPFDSESSASTSENPNPNSLWTSGGGLFKSVMENYRKDFEELRSGLKKETAVIREVASRAVKDLPTSLEIGASVAQESLESVGQAIDDIGSTVWKSTADIISQGRRNLSTQTPDHSYSYSDSDNNSNSRRLSDVKLYSRFERQLLAIGCNRDTYCREPEDIEEYENWKSGFELDDERNREIDSLVKENEIIGEIYGEAVLNTKAVDEETFWSRYFYRVHKLKQAEEARARLVKRAMEVEDEDLCWDFDDEDEENSGSLVKGESIGNLEEKRESDLNVIKKDDIENPRNKNSGVEEKDNEKVEVVEGNAENGESCKDSDLSVVSTQPSMPEEEDLGWDEIEDIGSNDENKGDAVGSISRAVLRKRLSAAEEDEDLSWDIEDDEEPIKS
ncbi:hypothetical protein Pint_24963 [Pistacia integerrima]|uniref:Uncharacterized protein n=1 Tax=Pistacia integerrima TaxID=434235 RepID=A0ACC0YB16_9ROSI|nr:hypothetical protein Pint_24963 [Pistacia integerrima]